MEMKHTCKGYKHAQMEGRSPCWSGEKRGEGGGWCNYERNNTVELDYHLILWNVPWEEVKRRVELEESEKSEVNVRMCFRD